MGFSVAGGQADGDVFDGAAKACHRMTFEVREYQIGIILVKSGAHIVFAENGSALHRQCHRTVLILDLNIRNGGKAVILRHLVVHGGAGSGAAVGGVALHNRSVYQVDQIGNQLRAQAVAARLAGGEFHSNLTAGRPLQGFIRGYQCLRRDI